MPAAANSKTAKADDKDVTADKVEVVETDAPNVPDVAYEEHANAEAQATPLTADAVEDDEDDYVPYVHEPEIVFAKTEAPQTEEA